MYSQLQKINLHNIHKKGPSPNEKICKKGPSPNEKGEKQWKI